ncbi:unnamed protein product [Agarophyton chilense]|eukprot:gb/GEZJ01002077.1/.p1 GENE.gb/GEZJ01002077.1/~~gb/GEZJ01002077.1/.p1  ORF type:complete len:575 (+),score=88.02 gb/GEZJ01002077.1/:6204-7928(+)
MIPDRGTDDLEAAKAAALRELFSDTGGDSAQTTNTEGNTKRSSKKTRRRRRPKSIAKEATTAQKQELEDGVETAVEYVPERIMALDDSTTSKHDGVYQDANVENIDDVISSMRRFMQRGIEERHDENEQRSDAEVNGFKSVNKKVQTEGTSEAGEAKLVENEAVESAKDETQDKPLSRKKQKELRRYQISVLKSLTDRPELVDSWDVTAPDPFLLVHLKTWPNSVQVPSNWRQKRKYLQNKRGMEKKAFQLPAYIADTGVGEMRSAQIEADQKKSLKQRQREKMRAKTGRGVDIDHSRLRDAFFKYQTKPRLTSQGDIYYELRELEVDGSRFRPGFLSEELRAALGVSEGDPPLWLVNMQRYGPPPGYPGLKIPGVNAPIPKGASYGYHIGGWGKPPVDEYGRPIYGDVFGEGLEFGKQDARFDLNDHEKKKLWGDLRKPGSKVTVAVGVEEESEDSDGNEGRDDAKQEKEAPRGATSRETHRMVSLPDEKNTRTGENPQQGTRQDSFYTVLEDRRVSVGQDGILGSSHVYDINRQSGEKAHAGSSRDKTSEKRPRESVEDKRDGPGKRSKFKF